MARSSKSVLLLPLVVLACVLVPFLFWHGSWFGRPLSDDEMGRYLEHSQRPRRIQHGLVQISERITRGDGGVVRWYGKVLSLADHPAVQIRTTVAWVMGLDGKAAEFHQKLVQMLHDPEPLVRRNAVLALVRFGDDSGRSELLAMLKSGDAEQVWEALRALYLVGREEDLSAIQALIDSPGLSEDLRRQARLTAAAIKSKRAKERIQ